MKIVAFIQRSLIYMMYVKQEITFYVIYADFLMARHIDYISYTFTMLAVEKHLYGQFFFK